MNTTAAATGVALGKCICTSFPIAFIHSSCKRPQLRKCRFPGFCKLKIACKIGQFCRNVSKTILDNICLWSNRWKGISLLSGADAFSSSGCSLSPLPPFWSVIVHLTWNVAIAGHHHVPEDIPRSQKPRCKEPANHQRKVPVFLVLPWNFSKPISR